MSRTIKANKQNSSRNKNYQFPYNGSVPAGIYRSKIDKIVETESTNKRPCFDVYRTLEDAHGHEYRIRERVAFDTPYEDELAERLVAAGVEEDTAYEDVTGVSEPVRLEYDDQSFGHTTPIPGASKRSKASPPGRHKAPTKDLFIDDDDDDDDLSDLDFDDPDL